MGSPRASTSATPRPGLVGPGDREGTHRGSPPPRRDGTARCHPARVTAPAARPQSAAATPGLQAGAGTANTPRCCIIYKLEEQRARQQLQSPCGPPCPASRSHRAHWHGGTAAPAARRDDRDKAACGAGRATGHPDVTLASPWTLWAAGAARGDVWCVPVSPALAQHPNLPPATPTCSEPPQPASCRLSLPAATPTCSWHDLPLVTPSRPLSPQPAPASAGPRCGWSWVMAAEGCPRASPRWHTGGHREEDAAPAFSPTTGSVGYGKQVFLKLCRIHPPPPPLRVPPPG